MLLEYLDIIAIAIGFWYAKKHGREAKAKINTYFSENPPQQK